MLQQNAIQVFDHAFIRLGILKPYRIDFGLVVYLNLPWCTCSTQSRLPIVGKGDGHGSLATVGGIVINGICLAGYKTADFKSARNNFLNEGCTAGGCGCRIHVVHNCLWQTSTWNVNDSLPRDFHAVLIDIHYGLVDIDNAVIGNDLTIAPVILAAIGHNDVAKLSRQCKVSGLNISRIGDLVSVCTTRICLRNGVLPAVIAVSVQLSIRDCFLTNSRPLSIEHRYGDAGPGVLHNIAIAFIDRIGHDGTGCRDLWRIDIIWIAINRNRPQQFLYSAVLLFHKLRCDALVDRRSVVDFLFDVSRVSGGISLTHSFDGVAALRNDLAIDHLELARVDDGRIGDRNNLLVCHRRYGVGETVAVCPTARVHRLAGTGCELDAVWIQRKSSASDGIGHDNVPA